MVTKLVLTKETERDIDEAYGWYEDRRRGLGEEFLSCVDACFQKICRTPELHARVHDDFRRALIRRFPYAVFYELTDSTVVVFSVFHTSQNPNKWRERLR